VQDVLKSVREEQPHTLEAVDITDDDKKEWYSKYKYDIPVLHVKSSGYWTKHKLTADDALLAIKQARNGDFTARDGEPDAGEMERRQAERRG